MAGIIAAEHTTFGYDCKGGPYSFCLHRRQQEGHDLAGLKVAQYPAILIELGNMRNRDDAAQMESQGGRTNYAAAVTRGIAAYLARSLPVQR
jgi:N-acetylmuramoyl-L-alanine amidase